MSQVPADVPPVDAAAPQATPAPKRRHGPIHWILRISLIGVPLLAVGVEAWGRTGVQMSRQRLAALIASRVTEVPGDAENPPKAVVKPSLTMEEIRGNLMLMPHEWSSALPKGKIVGFSWPSFTGSHLRVRLSSDDKILAVDTATTADDDFVDALVRGDGKEMTVKSKLQPAATSAPGMSSPMGSPASNGPGAPTAPTAPTAPSAP